MSASLLTIGAMNTYFAGGSKLGAALGRDGAFPGWFARGSRSGEVPRRSLAVIVVLALAALGVVALTGVGPKPVVLLTTGSLGLVYVLGTAAALRLLPPGSWSRRGAGLALGFTLALLATTGPYVLWTLAVASAALAYVARRRRRAAAHRVVPQPCLAG